MNEVCHSRESGNPFSLDPGSSPGSVRRGNTKTPRRLIYLDYNATSPLRPEALEAMKPFFTEEFGNPSSFHQQGQKARYALENARERLLELLGKRSGRLVFTSSATEANNLAISGFALKNKSRAGHFVCSAIEHPSVLRPLELLREQGMKVTVVGPNQEGIVSVESMMRAAASDTLLVSLMAANNETGTLEPVHELAQALKKTGAKFHVDAVQVFGRMKYDFSGLAADCITLSAHKIGGPKGVGALWFGEGVQLTPLLSGGHHEGNLRAGTENVPAIIGFVKAAEMAFCALEKEEARLRALCDKLAAKILSLIPEAYINGSRASYCLPNTLNVSFPGLLSESLLILLDSKGIAASSGAACTSGALEVSHVLRAMNLPEERLRSAVRFSLGPGTRDEDIEYLAQNLPGWVRQLRQ
ncbi:MAG: cysteine desulfurase [Candidatus Omnitrophica bacterium]|nr:cysteine desulfurase [Candidatus Omnitrophota bacterium]